MFGSRHFFDPLIPSIPGLEYFGGLVMHSHDYRDPHPFQGKHVVVLGASSSGQDISLEIAKMAERVYLSHKGHLSCKLPDNVEECRPMSCVSSNGVVHFDDGEQKEVDAILFCTGYNFSFPFLQSDCGVEVSDNRVTPLYKHVFSTKYHTLSFVGLCLRICPFPVFSFQAQFIAAVLSGKAKLPSEEEMNAEEEQEFKEKLASGLRKKYAHFLGEKQWDYMRCLAQLAGVQPPSEACENLYKFISKRRKEFLMDYKNDEYEFTSNGKWKKKIDM